MPLSKIIFFLYLNDFKQIIIEQTEKLPLVCLPDDLFDFQKINLKGLT